MGPAIPVTAAIMRPVGVRSKTATAVMTWRQILFSPALRRFADLLFLRMGSAILTQPHIASKHVEAVDCRNVRNPSQGMKMLESEGRREGEREDVVNTAYRCCDGQEDVE